MLLLTSASSLAAAKDKFNPDPDSYRDGKDRKSVRFL
jgi:hypothetical protein